MSLIRIEQVSHEYGAPGRPVLDGIDLEIEEGEFVCLLGETGCGKSTLLRLVLGAEAPAHGRILIDGVEHNRPDRTRGYVPQKYSLFPDKTVMDNITFGPEVSEFSLFTRLAAGDSGGAGRSCGRRRPSTCGGSGSGREMARSIRTSFRAGCSSAWRSRRR